MDKKLHKSRTNKYIGGICGGLGEYLSIDPTILRLMMVLLAFATSGILVIVYIVMCFIIPYPDEDTGESAAYRKISESADRANINNEKQKRYMGIILVTLGSLLFLKNILPNNISKFVIPIAAVIIGLIIIISALAGDDESEEIPDAPEVYTSEDEKEDEEFSFISPAEDDEKNADEEPEIRDDSKTEEASDEAPPEETQEAADEESPEKDLDKTDGTENTKKERVFKLDDESGVITLEEKDDSQDRVQDTKTEEEDNA